MDKSCINCRFYEPWPRKLRYPRGKCNKQFAFRIPDGYKIYLDIITPHEYTCTSFEEKERPIYALVENKAYLVPPAVAIELVSKGWVTIQMTEDGEIIKRQEDL